MDQITLQISRDEFVTAIEKGIAAAARFGTPLSVTEALRLRRLAQVADTVSVGEFEDCPATQAGIYVAPATPAVMTFATSFDGAIGDLNPEPYTLVSRVNIVAAKG